MNDIVKIKIKDIEYTLEEAREIYHHLASIFREPMIAAMGSGSGKTKWDGGMGSGGDPWVVSGRAGK